MNLNLKEFLPIRKNFWQPDYRIYRFSIHEFLMCFLLGMGACLGLIYFFYQSLILVPFSIPGALVLCYLYKNDLRDKRRRILENQFKDLISGVASNLQAGYSIENAFVKAGDDLKIMYPAHADIRMEAKRMGNLLENNVTLEKIMMDLGKRSGSGDLCNFAEVFAASKRSGGDFREMIESCCQVILMKLEVEKEIQLLIHGKKMEQKIMCLVPFMIMLYISISSPGYFQNLYHNPAGILIMTLCLGVYLLSVILSDRITRIEV